MLRGTEKVTIVMTTFNNNDFTRASLWSVKKYYPEIKIILTDGGSSSYNYEGLYEMSTQDKNMHLMQFVGGSTEECRNAAASVVETDYVLFMDNDVKITNAVAIPMLVQTLEQSDRIVQTGAYGIRVVDRENKKAYVGTEFTDNMIIHGSPAYFSMHKTKAYREVGGMPKEWFYDLPEDLVNLWNKTFEDLGKSGPGYTGDFTITKKYNEKGWIAVTPDVTVPVLHWSQANKWFTDVTQNRELETWWFEKVKHIRCNPLNDWEHLEKKHNGNSK